MTQSTDRDAAGGGSGNGNGSIRPGNGRAAADTPIRSFLRALLRRLRRTEDPSARDSLEELMEEREEGEIPLDEDERTLVANILSLRDRSVDDAMVPRADIVSVHGKASLAEVVQIMTREGHSRLPIYRDTLDDAIGMVHIRDVLAWREKESEFDLSRIMRSVLFVPPSMKVLELLLEMRAKRCHMALVVDEFGGVDGLATIEDLVEEIVGEIQDEHDREPEPELHRRGDGLFDADARMEVEALEVQVGPFLSDEEREEIDTLGGLVFALAGRVPVRGELIAHPSGVEFEVLDADPRRIRRLRIRAPADLGTTEQAVEGELVR